MTNSQVHQYVKIMNDAVAVAMKNPNALNLSGAGGLPEISAADEEHIVQQA